MAVYLHLIFSRCALKKRILLGLVVLLVIEIILHTSNTGNFKANMSTNSSVCNRQKILPFPEVKIYN